MEKLVKIIFVVLTILLPNYAYAQSFKEEIRTKCIELDEEDGEYVYSEYTKYNNGKYIGFRSFWVLDDENKKDFLSTYRTSCTPQVIVAEIIVKNDMALSCPYISMGWHIEEVLGKKCPL